MILAVFALCGCDWKANQKIRLVASSVHAGDTEESLVNFANSQGWQHEKFAKQKEYGKFSAQDYAFILCIYEKTGAAISNFKSHSTQREKSFQEESVSSTSRR